MPDDGLIRRSLPCAGCGYDLRGLVESGLCPECGRSAADSVRAVSLVNAPLDHVAHLARSSLLIEIGAWLSTLTLMLGVSMFLICLAFPALIAAVIVSSVGWLLLVSRSASWEDDARLERRKRWVFWLVIARAAALLGWVPALMVVQQVQVGSVQGFTPGAATFALILTIVGAKHALGLTVLRDLFRLSGGPRMATLTHVMSRIAPWIFALGIAFFLFDGFLSLPEWTTLVFWITFFAFAIAWSVTYAVAADLLRLRLAWLRNRRLFSMPLPATSAPPPVPPAPLAPVTGIPDANPSPPPSE